VTALPTLDPGFSTPAMSAVFDVGSRLSLMLAFERELARAQGALGLIPEDAATAIADACARVRLDDPASLAQRGWALGTPLSPLLELLRAQLAPAHAPYLHRGATTQDAVDTAAMLQVREGLALLDRALREVAKLLRALVVAHRATPMMARTLLQHALPTTFGVTAARWLAPLAAAATTLRQVRAGLPLQLGGAVGALDGFGVQTRALVERLAHALGLVAPPLAWHGDRAPIGEVVHAVTVLTRALEKLASDLVLLAQSDVGEVRMRGGGSSSMPHKQNPIDAVRARAAGAATLHFAAALLTSGPHELDRAAGAWHLEWLLVPLLFHAAAATVEATHAALAGLEVDVTRMAGTAGARPPPDSHVQIIAAVLAQADACWDADAKEKP